MLDHLTIKDLASQLGLAITDLVPMSKNNEPFLADLPARRAAAEWFAGLFHEFGFGRGVHLRRIHYRLLSSTSLTTPVGAYENTMNCWSYLVNASRDARYLELVPSEYFIVRRNPDPQIFAVPGRAPVHYLSDGSISYAGPSGDFPDLPGFSFASGEPPMPYLVEVWCEKTTMNDVLVPLCRKRRVNFVAGAGEMSETQTRLLMERAIAANKPVRIFYVSDFDPAGRSMPVAVSRRIEFYLAKNDHEVDMRLIPLVLSAQQCQEYNLPRTLIKETERRAARFEAQFGEGATELDALEALHPGTLEKLTDRAISRYLNPDYPRDFYAAATEYREALRGRCQINLHRAAGTRSRMRIHAAATAFRHSLAASARKIRSVDRETRWR